MENLKIKVVRLFGAPSCRVLLCYKPNIAPLSLVVNGLGIRRVVDQLGEAFRDLVSFALPTLLCVLVNILHKV